MAKTNAAYWAERMKQMEDALQNQAYDYVQNMEHQFAIAQAEIEKEIAVWYQRLAANNGVSLAEAKKMLDSGQLKEFHWTVQEYIKHGKENALSQQWMKEMENASARVHISKLDALKIQLQQQAELLHGKQLEMVNGVARDMYVDSYFHTAFELQRGIGVGVRMPGINQNALNKILARPWTQDGKTFSDRIWTNKQALVNSVNTQLTQMIIRGESPQAAIDAIASQFNVSKRKAGRLIMTESAYFASAAQKDCYKDLGVELYQIVATLDHTTCEICGALDSQVFKMSDYEVGTTAPPFHPWCRCCTCPYYEDMAHLGERWARNEDGSTTKVPRDMSYNEWKENFGGKIGGSVPGESVGLIGEERSGILPTPEFKLIVGNHTLKDDVGTPLSPICNPHYNEKGLYSSNCACACAAFELRRRGFDVEANPHDLFYFSRWEKLFQNADPMMFIYGGRGSLARGVAQEIKKLYPDGSRGSIFANWKEGKLGHYFSWEIQNGVVRFVDPQRGITNAAKYFSEVAPNTIHFARWDNLQPSDYIRVACKNRG